MRWYFWCLLSLVFLSPRPAVSQAQTDKPLPGWGDVLDPGKDASIRLEGDQLAITVPGGLHELRPAPRKMNAPRVMRDVEGNFEVSVKISAPFDSATGRDSAEEPANSGFGAGLLIWQDERNFIEFYRVANVPETPGRKNEFALEYWMDGKSTGWTRTAEPRDISERDYWLRLARRGDKLKAEVSPDGENWADLGTIPVRLSSRMRLGVLVSNGSKEPYEAHFSNLRQKAIPLYPPRDK